MTFEYIGVDEAMARDGLRMVVLGGVPSPWSEAAKGFFHIKRIPWVATRLVYDSEALKTWAGATLLNAPIVALDDEPRRLGWEDILLLAEKLAPVPALLPAEAEARSRALALSAKFCAPNGLGWMRRLQNVHAGLRKTGGFSERIAGYLGQKYGYTPEIGETAGARTRELLAEIGSTLRARRAAGKEYYLVALSAVDVYSATFMALFKPLPEAVCAMNPGVRAAFEWLDAETTAEIDPILFEHRDMMYARHLELPLAL
jgi:hypothetical protein